MATIALLDSNVWASALINPDGKPARVISAWQDDRILVVASDYLLREVANVLSRSRIRDKNGSRAQMGRHIIYKLQLQRSPITLDKGAHEEGLSKRNSGLPIGVRDEGIQNLVAVEPKARIGVFDGCVIDEKDRDRPKSGDEGRRARVPCRP